MKVTLIEPQAPEWSATLAATAHDVYHLPEYVSLSAKHDGGVPRALLAEDEQGRRLLLPLVIREIDGGRTDATSPYGYPGPLVVGTGDPGFVAEAMAESAQHLGTEGVVSAFVRLHPLLPVEGLGEPWTVVYHGETVVMDLSEPTEELWRQTRSSHRRHVNKAMRQDHVFQMDAGADDDPAFRDLYRATMARHQAASYYFFDDDYFDALREFLGDRYHIATVRIDGVVAAAALFTETCGFVEFLLSGHDDTYARSAPTIFLIHGARSWAKAKGYRWLHLGGGFGARADGLFGFKAGFSGATRPYHTMRIVLDPGAYRELSAEAGADVDPEDTSGYFPAYRLSAPTA